MEQRDYGEKGMHFSKNLNETKQVPDSSSRHQDFPSQQFSSNPGPSLYQQELADVSQRKQLIYFNDYYYIPQ